MKKKEYIKPSFSVVKIAPRKIITASQFDAPVLNPNDEVNAADAL